MGMFETIYVCLQCFQFLYKKLKKTINCLHFQVKLYQYPRMAIKKGGEINFCCISVCFPKCSVKAELAFKWLFSALRSIQYQKGYFRGKITPKANKIANFGVIWDRENIFPHCEFQYF